VRDPNTPTYTYRYGYIDAYSHSVTDTNLHRYSDSDS